MIKDMSFGALFRGLRLKNGETLRQYCIKRNLDIGNMSKLERNIMAPPRSIRQLMKYLYGLNYSTTELEFLICACQNYQIDAALKRFDKI